MSLSLNKLLFLIFFCLALLSDHIILNKLNNKKVKYYYLHFRDNTSYITMKIIIFIVIFPIIYFFNIGSFSDFNIFEYLDIHLSVSEDSSDKANIELGKNSKVDVTINNPNGSIKVNGNAISHLAAALSSAGGATVAYKVAKNAPGTPTTKLAAGLFTMATVQGTTYVMSNILSKGNGNNKNNLVSFLSNFYVSGSTLEDYPLNLLLGLNDLFYASLLGITILLNIYLARYFINKNYSKYIPNKYLGSILIKLLDRYTNIWSKTSKFLLVYIYLGLLWCLGLSKLCMYIILYDNNIHINVINNYPFNLIIYVNILLNISLLYLIIIFNIYFYRYILNKNYWKYNPNNNFAYILNKILDKYITILNKTNKFLLIFSIVILLISVILGKFCLFLIINS